MRSGSSFFFCIIWHSSLAFWGQTHRPSKFLANLPPTSTVGRNKLAQQLLHSEEASIYASAAAAEDTIPIQTVKPEQIDQVILAEEDDQTTSLSAVELQELIAASPHLVHRETFHQVFSTALKHSKLDQIDRIESLFQKMKQLPNCSPTRVTYELVQQLWLRCHNHQLTRDDPQVWMAHLRDLWSLHDESSSTNDNLLPRKSTYLATLKGLMQCQHKSNILDITKKLFDDMLRYSAKYPALTPDIKTANHVMMVWNKFGGQERSRAFLDRLEMLASDGGSPQLRPNRYSYCLVLDALAKGNRSAEQAEELLVKMKANGCEPDTIAYNTVLGAWARSKATDAPQRAKALIQQLQREWDEGLSNARPDIVSYNTVLHALSQTRKGYHESQRFLDQMEKRKVESNIISYNILIAALSEDKSVKNATQAALGIFEKIQDISDQRKYANFEPDCATYSSLIKVLSKETDRDHPRYAEKAIELLEGLEEKYDASRDPAIAPNVMSYTATISCIGRSGVGPERAHAIIDRMEQRFVARKSRAQPDHICYNALINAYGWSDIHGRALQSYRVFQRMLELSSSRGNVKPDIITCNSVLNACAHETAESTQEREAILSAAIEVYEFFRTNAPHYGRFNHITFDRMLKVVARNVADEWKRHSMAESIFAQCCLGGHVSVLVVSTVFGLLPYDRLAELLGDALVSKKDDPLHFNWKLLPSEYTKFAPRPNRKSFSKGSQNKRPRVQNPSDYRVNAKKRVERSDVLRASSS